MDHRGIIMLNKKKIANKELLRDVLITPFRQMEQNKIITTDAEDIVDKIVALILESNIFYTEATRTEVMVWKKAYDDAETKAYDHSLIGWQCDVCNEKYTLKKDAQSCKDKHLEQSEEGKYEIIEVGYCFKEHGNSKQYPIGVRLVFGDKTSRVYFLKD